MCVVICDVNCYVVFVGSKHLSIVCDGVDCRQSSVLCRPGAAICGVRRCLDLAAGGSSRAVDNGWSSTRPDVARAHVVTSMLVHVSDLVVHLQLGSADFLVV